MTSGVSVGSGWPLIRYAPARERFAFIDRLRDRFSVKRQRRVTITDRGSFYKWVRAQVHRDERLTTNRKTRSASASPAAICSARCART